MKMKNKIAALSTLLMLQFGAANAAAIDEELETIANEKRNNNRVEIFDPDKQEPAKKSEEELREELRRLEEERKAARKKIEEERKRGRDEITGKVPISKNPVPPDRNTKPEDVVQPPVEVIEPVEQKPVEVVEPPVEISNPIKNYSSFAEIAQAVNFTPLYIPKKSGYTITSMLTINNLAEIRYSRKWEPNVSLHIRTYKRAPGEELKEISGVNGAKWRINVVDDVTVYISKIDENKHVAAWAVGNYTFSAYVENLSFAAFYSFVSRFVDSLFCRRLIE